MLTIQDFPQCPRFTWVASYFDELDSSKIRVHLVVIMALLVHDGIYLEQVADMFLWQKNRLAKTLPRLKKEALIYDGIDGRLFLRGNRSRFLWSRNDGFPTADYVTDYEMLKTFLKDLKKREENCNKKKSYSKKISFTVLLCCYYFAAAVSCICKAAV